MWSLEIKNVTKFKRQNVTEKKKQTTYDINFQREKTVNIAFKIIINLINYIK